MTLTRAKCPTCGRMTNLFDARNGGGGWCTKCQKIVSATKHELVRSTAVEYMALTDSDVLHLRAKGHVTRCGVHIPPKRQDLRYFSIQPPNVCQRCLSVVSGDGAAKESPRP